MAQTPCRPSWWIAARSRRPRSGSAPRSGTPAPHPISNGCSAVSSRGFETMTCKTILADASKALPERRQCSMVVERKDQRLIISSRIMCAHLLLGPQVDPGPVGRRRLREPPLAREEIRPAKHKAHCVERCCESIHDEYDCWPTRQSSQQSWPIVMGLHWLACS